MNLNRRTTGQGYENATGPGLAEKPRCSKLFGLFAQLARPIDGRVDFYHTNFSRRSHPRHLEFLQLGRMMKS